MRVASVLAGLAGLSVFAPTVVHGQATEKPEFEVASIRPAPNLGYPGPGISRGGPGTPDPGQLTFEHATLALLIRLAYGVEDFQVTGPSWIESERYDIAAKVPEGTTKAQSNVMLQNLLKERFKLGFHHETKEFQAY